MRLGWCGDQQVRCAVALADSTLFNREPRAAQRVDHLGHRTELKAVFSEGHFFHRLRVGHSDNDATRASYHPSQLAERTIQVGYEVDGVGGKDAVQCAIGEGQLGQ